MTLQSDLDQHITHTVDQGSSFRAAYLACNYWQDLLVFGSSWWKKEMNPVEVFLLSFETVTFDHEFSIPLKLFACLKVNNRVNVHRCWLWPKSKWCSAGFGKKKKMFSKSLNSLVLDMHRRLELFPVSKCPIWGRHATVGQRCVNLAVSKHTQSCCQELDYLKEFSAQKQRRILSWSLQPFPANALGYDRWQETGAAN